MAVPSSNLLLLLLISSLDWLSTPGSAFLMGRDHMTPSGRLLVIFAALFFQDKISRRNRLMRDKSLFRQLFNLSTCSSSNINKKWFRFCVQHAVDTCYHVLCQTSVAECCVCLDTCGKVHCWANAAVSRFGLSNRLVINRASVNIWLGLLCQSPGTGRCRMFGQLTQLSLNDLK